MTEYDAFHPGQIWLDTSGDPIHAHGGSIIVEDGVYYWYGENKEHSVPGSGIWTWGIRCYSSTDLYNWDDRGLIIPPDLDDPTSPLHPSQLIDRPHIIRNDRTGKYVCWLKIMGEGDTQLCTVLTADTLLGPYEIAVADTYHGPYTVLGNPHRFDSSGTSYRSQISSVFRHPAVDDLYIALADRWLPHLWEAESDQTQAFHDDFAARATGRHYTTLSLPEADTSLATYVWLPIWFDGDIPIIEWHDQWRVDTTHHTLHR